MLPMVFSFAFRSASLTAAESMSSFLDFSSAVFSWRSSSAFSLFCQGTGQLCCSSRRWAGGVGPGGDKPSSSGQLPSGPR